MPKCMHFWFETVSPPILNRLDAKSGIWQENDAETVNQLVYTLFLNLFEMVS